MAPSMSPEQKQWVGQQKLPAPDRVNPGNECLLRLQSESPIVKARLYVGDQAPLTNGEVLFQICPSPIGAVFRLECAPYALLPNQQMTQQQLKLYTEERLVAEFSAYEQEYPVRRTPVAYVAKEGNTPPPGPISFSSQLHDVAYIRGDNAALGSKANPNVAQRSKELCFRWRAERCSQYAFDRPFPAEQQSIANKFKAMIRTAVQKSAFIVVVVTKNAPPIATNYWTYFCSAPNPTLPSFFPWVSTVDLSDSEEWKTIMEFPPNRNFELFPAYLERALAVREKNWYRQGGEIAVEIVPSPLTIVKLHEVIHFRDYRQYLAVILGSYAYEEMRARADVGSSYNGLHHCLIFSKAAAMEGTRRYLILFNIRPKRNVDTGADAKLPQAGERASITLEYGSTNQTWTGNVIDIPKGQRKHGFNTAVVVTSSPTIPLQGRIMVDSVNAQADVYFGHQGQNTGKAKQSIMAFMTNHLKKLGSDITAQFFKEVVLAQNSWLTFSEAKNRNASVTVNSLPDHIKHEHQMLGRILEVCKSRGLSKNQTAIVQHYFTHRITLVRGPPGTGKSTLIDVIVSLEEEFKQTHWICTDSNEACNVLVHKTIDRRKSMQPSGSIRVRPMFEEKLDYSMTREGNMTFDTLIKEKPDGLKGDLLQAVETFLAEPSNLEQVMSLGNLIKLRMTLYFTGKLHTPMWPSEFNDYTALVKACKAFQTLKFEQDATAFIEEQQRLERKYLQQLRKVQERHVRTTLGVYSTAAASASPLMNHFAPKAMIMDEASQSLEATAVSAILHAIERKSLSRLLLIGDDMQLPPTVMATNNPFRSTAVLSLFERLIRSGAPVQTLTEQYRMEPTISSIVITHIYHPRGVTLTDGFRTPWKLEQDARFRKFLKTFSTTMGKQTFGGKTNAIVISPVKPKTDMSWKAQKLAGSTSKINLTTAKIVMRTVYELINFGYLGSDILLICFYSDQVQVLQAFFEGESLETLKGIKVTTVDGSQGQERKVVVIDCVVLGAANGDGMGFLSVEKRRFNVAMSRAQHGRIVVAHRDMVTNPKDTTIWNPFMQQATILDGTTFNDDIPSAAFNTRMMNILSSFQKKTASHDSPRNPPKPATTARARDGEMAFTDATGASAVIAKEYLNRYKDVHVAVDRYLQAHPDDSFIVEEISRGMESVKISE